VSSGCGSAGEVTGAGPSKLFVLVDLEISLFLEVFVSSERVLRALAGAGTCGWAVVEVGGTASGASLGRAVASLLIYAFFGIVSSFLELATVAREIAPSLTDFLIAFRAGCFLVVESILISKAIDLNLMLL
jgi:hypothetical protein